MGVDCMLFARRAKACVWIDRQYNVGWVPNHEAHTGVWWLGYLLGMDKGTQSTSIAGHEYEYANRAIARAFIEKHGVDDEYFIVTDSHDPSCHEHAEANGYTREGD